MDERTEDAIMPSQEPTTQTQKLKELVEKPWVLVILVLHVGLLGLPVYWKLNYSFGARLLIILASIAYTVFAVLVIIWGCRQIALLFGY